MKKIFRYKFLLAAALVVPFVSCSDDDDTTLSTRLEKPVVTAAISATTVNEGDAITITLTSSKAINTEMEFKLDVLNTSTGGFRDLTSSEDVTETTVDTGFGQLGFYVTMPAYTTTYSFTITPTVDLEAEGSETFNFRFYGDGNSNGMVAETSEFFTVTVNNTVSDDFVAKLDWSDTTTDVYGSLVPGTYASVDSGDLEYCGFDFDMEIYDAGLNLVAFSYNDCPEVAVLPADAPDGDYIVAPSFYTNAVGSADDEPAAGDIEFKADVTIAKPGAFKSVIDMDGQWTYAAGGLNDGNDAAIIPVAIVTKTGTTYTATTMDGELLGTGRMASLVQKLAAKRKAHLKN